MYGVQSKILLRTRICRFSLGKYKHNIYIYIYIYGTKLPCIYTIKYEKRICLFVYHMLKFQECYSIHHFLLWDCMGYPRRYSSNPQPCHPNRQLSGTKVPFSLDSPHIVHCSYIGLKCQYQVERADQLVERNTLLSICRNPWHSIDECLRMGYHFPGNNIFPLKYLFHTGP